MTHTTKPLDLAVSVITSEALGSPDSNRILAFRDGKTMLLDTGEMGDPQDLIPEDRGEDLDLIDDEPAPAPEIDMEAHTLRMLYLAIERIGQLERQVITLLDGHPDAANELEHQREDAFDAALKTFSFGEGVTIEEVGGTHQHEDNSEWILDLKLREGERLFDATFHVGFQPGSPIVLWTKAEDAGRNRRFGQLG